MRRDWAVAAAVSAEIILLLFYYAQANVWISASAWWNSFGWWPTSGAFEWAPFLGLSLVALFSCAAFMAWMILAALLGHTLLLHFNWTETARDRQMVLSLGLGLGALSLAAYFLGLTGGLIPPIVLATSVGLFAWCGWIEYRAGAALRPPTHPSRWLHPLRWLHRDPALQERANRPLWLVGTIAAMTLAFHFLGVLLPPAAFDELNYQLSLPKLYAMHHGFVYTPFNHLSFLPRNINMLYALGLISGGPIVAKLISWATGVLAAWALYAFGRAHLGRRAAFLAAIAFFLTPVVGNQFRVALVDLGCGFYELLGVFLFLRWREDRSTRTLALSSGFWGFALGSKYSALPGFAACGLALAWTALRDPARIRISPDGARIIPPGADTETSTNASPISATAVVAVFAVFVVPAVALWSPWLLQNWWETGNPINPILSRWIRSRNFYFAGDYKPLVDYSVGLGIANYFPIHGVRDLALLPWRLLTWHNDFNHDLGPLWLLCVPLALLPRLQSPPRWLRSVIGLCALYWLLWFGGSVHMTRYFVAGLGLTSLVAGWIIATALQDPRWSWALLAPILFAWAQQSQRMTYVQNHYKRPWGYLAGRCSLGDYIDAVTADSPYDAFAYVNAKTPRDATVLVFDEFRTFYLDREFIASTPWDHDYWHELVHVSHDPDDLSRRLRERGIGYFLANDNYLRHRSGLDRPDAWSQEDTVKARRFIRDRMQRLYYSDEGAWVAKIKDPS